MRDGVNVPLIIHRSEGGEVWVQAHHPLVNEPAMLSPVRKAAEAAFVELCPLDVFMLRHDLPNAFRKLQLERLLMSSEQFYYLTQSSEWATPPKRSGDRAKLLNAG